jgi:hypothetical protein
MAVALIRIRGTGAWGVQQEIRDPVLLLRIDPKAEILIDDPFPFFAVNSQPLLWMLV